MRSFIDLLTRRANKTPVALGLKWMPLDVKKQRLELALNSVGTLLPGQKLDVKVKTINAS